MFLLSAQFYLLVANCNEFTYSIDKLDISNINVVRNTARVHPEFNCDLLSQITEFCKYFMHDLGVILWKDLKGNISVWSLTQ